jgi:hypothetical protein
VIILSTELRYEEVSEVFGSLDILSGTEQNFESQPGRECAREGKSSGGIGTGKDKEKVHGSELSERR